VKLEHVEAGRFGIVGKLQVLVEGRRESADTGSDRDARQIEKESIVIPVKSQAGCSLELADVRLRSLDDGEGAVVLQNGEPRVLHGREVPG
jgi:hypothetical protein